jgi:HSP20 family protein
MAGMDELMRLARRLRLASGEGVQPLQWRPAADVYRTDDGWLVKFELAGVDPDEIELFTHDRILLVRGRRCDRELIHGCQFHSLEITYSQFERCVELPASLDAARIETEYRQGMLLVHVRPRRPADESQNDAP